MRFEFYDLLIVRSFRLILGSFGLVCCTVRYLPARLRSLLRRYGCYGLDAPPHTPLRAACRFRCERLRVTFGLRLVPLVRCRRCAFTCGALCRWTVTRVGCCLGSCTVPPRFVLFYGTGCGSAFWCRSVPRHAFTFATRTVWYLYGGAFTCVSSFAMLGSARVLVVWTFVWLRVHRFGLGLGYPSSGLGLRSRFSVLRVRFDGFCLGRLRWLLTLPGVTGGYRYGALRCLPLLSGWIAAGCRYVLDVTLRYLRCVTFGTPLMRCRCAVYGCLPCCRSVAVHFAAVADGPTAGYGCLVG
jgi:hypothetical protein